MKCKEICILQGSMKVNCYYVIIYLHTPHIYIMMLSNIGARPDIYDVH